jgi:hypothetical protein
MVCFAPPKKHPYEAYKFRQAKQGLSETIDQFRTRLHSLSKNCEFSDVDFEIKIQIVIGEWSSRTRKQALRDPKYSLKDLLLYVKKQAKHNYSSSTVSGAT